VDNTSTIPSTPCPKCAPLFAQLETRLKKQDALIRQQDAKIQALEERFAVLEGRSRQNSSNSSKPPSSDGYSKPSPQSSRISTGRRPGGQKGHPGSTLKAVAKPDQVVVHPLQLCLGCHHSLGRQPILGHEKRQVFDLPNLRFLVTEHQAEIRYCPFCRCQMTASFPPEVQAPAQYGHRLLAWWTYLKVQQLLPLERICQMTADLFRVQVSEATLQSALQAAASKLEGFEAKIKSLLQQAPLAHADETGLRVTGQLHWFHNLSTPLLTWYGVHPKRGGKALESFGLLKRFTGRLIHDCWAPYFALKRCLHGLCNAHLLRELIFLQEVESQPWAGEMHALLMEMYLFVTRRKQFVSKLGSKQKAWWHNRYRTLLRKGWAANPARAPSAQPSRGRPKKTKAQNLLCRLQQHENSVLAFLDDFRVPFTNNQAEQDLRMVKVQQKVSGTFRTLQGALVFARIRSYVSTVRKHQRDVFGDMVRLFQNKPFIPQKAV
jgi:transposase